jgi:broad specificity phosphatase PhoE
MKIFLLRHGETTSDIEDRYGGDYEDHLTERGIAQSNELAEKLSDKVIEVIFSSPRIRAKETAEILMANLGCGLEIVDDLRERNAYGILTGMVKGEAMEKYPEHVEAVKSYGNTIEGAESYEHLTERVKACFDALAAKPHQTIAILTHGGVIRCFLREVMRLPELGSLGDCAIIEIEGSQGDLKLINLNGATMTE